MMFDDFVHGLGDWLLDDGPSGDVVLSSRVRLARNVANLAFPHRLEEEERRDLVDQVTEACALAPALHRAALWDLERLTGEERQLLVERHLASKHLAEGNGPRAVVVQDGESEVVMINEEDHVRIQCVRAGLNLPEALRGAIQVDRELEETLEFAFREDFGYLTACPTNVGTGLRASALLHLPALVLAGEIKKVHRAVSEMGMAVRGWFGEGSSALGDFYQVSNQRTLGRTEEQALADLEKVVVRVVELETEARDRLKQSISRTRRMEDRFFRAYGTLRSARLLTVEQTMACASDVRLARWFGFLTDVPVSLLNRLAFFAQPAHLGRRVGRSLKGDEANWARAAWIRSAFDESCGSAES